MPLPVGPIAVVALRYGAVAVASAVVAKKLAKPRSEKDVTREAAWTRTPEGLEISRVDHEDETQFEASHGHWQRIWFGGGHGVEFDSRVLARLRLRRLRPETGGSDPK